MIMAQEYYPEVIQAIAGPDYIVYAYFSDGAIKRFDAKPLIEKGGVFTALKDKVFFSERLMFSMIQLHGMSAEIMIQPNALI